MAGAVVDIHPHIISSDTKRYPLAPLFGVQSDWSRERPASETQLLAAMDEAGVKKAAIVHASTCYGFDNSYVADAVEQYPERFTAVGSIDMLAPDAASQAMRWIDRGLTGFRIFTGGSTKEVDASALDDVRSFPVWELLDDRGLSMCIQTDASGLAASAALAHRFPNVAVIVDHLARPDLTGGPPFAAAAPLSRLAPVGNVYLKLTPVTLKRVRECGADVHAFIQHLVGEFGADRIAWGSNWPNSPGSLSEILAETRAAISVLDAADQDAVLGGTALRLYPALAT